MEYSTSAVEINRRKLAFLSLSISMIFGTFISSTIYQISLPMLVYLALSISLFLLGSFAFYFFRKLSTLKINLLANLLQRKLTRVVEEYPLNIKKVKIKWTAHNSIREVYIWLNNGRSVFLTGLNNFEGFRIELLARLEKQTIVQEWREPVNFDSVWFYPFLGGQISNLVILAFKNLILLDYHQIKLGMSFFGVYLLLFGLYFILAKPISRRSGNATRQQDYVMGILMLLAGTFIVFG